MPAISTIHNFAPGLIRERRVGRARLLSANPASRYTRPLTELVSLAFGPQFVVAEEFGALGAAAVAAASLAPASEDLRYCVCARDEIVNADSDTLTVTAADIFG